MSPAATFPQLWRELRELEDEVSVLCNTLSPRYDGILNRLRIHLQKLRKVRAEVPEVNGTTTPADEADPLPAGTLLARVLPMVDAQLLRTHRLAR